MPKPIRSKKKAATKPRKRKGKVVVRESVKVRPKTTAKPDTMIIAPSLMVLIYHTNLFRGLLAILLNTIGLLLWC